MPTIITFKDKATLTVDAALSETHGRSAEITQNPAEDGVDVADHIQPKPYTLNVTAVVAYRPIAGAQTPETETNRLLAVVVDSEEPEANRHIKAFNRLEQAVDKRELVTVQTGLKVYRDMAIRAITFPREARTGYDLVFSLELQQVRFASARTATVPADAIGKPKPSADAAQAKKDKAKTQDQATAAAAKGQKAKQTPTAAQAGRIEQVKTDTRPKSLLKQGLGALGLGG